MKRHHHNQDPEFPEAHEAQAKRAFIKQDLIWWNQTMKTHILGAVLNIGLTASHVMSYNELLTIWLKDIVLTSGKIDLTVEKNRYQTTLSNYRFVGSPISPSEAHNNNLSYNGTVYVDVMETVSRKQNELWSPVSSEVVRNIPICKIPIMLLSLACNLHEKGNVVQQLEPELGGSFVVRGKRRYIPMVKSLMNNYSYLMYNTQKNQKYVQVRSNHLLSMHRSTSTLEMFLDVEKLTKNGPTLKTPKIRIPFLVIPVPLWVIVSALGWDIDTFLSTTEACIGSALTSHQWKQYVVITKGTWLMQTKEQALIHLNKLYSKPPNDNTAQLILNSEILPHLNGTSDQVYTKCFYIAYMFSLLLLFEENAVKESDRDSSLCGRVVSSGQLLASLFRILFLAFMRQAHKIIRRNFKQNKPMEVAKIYKESRLSQRLLSAVATGIWSSRRKGVSHQLVTGNNQSIVGQMRRISSSVLNSDGKHILPRMIQADSYGYICAAETQEGEGCGLVSSLASTARLSIGTDNATVTQIFLLQLGENFVPLPVNLSVISHHWYKLFDSMGLLLGFVRDVTEAVSLFQQLRRSATIDFFTTFAQDDDRKEFRFECGAGRLLRPLLVVENMAKIPAIIATSGFSPSLLNLLLAEGCLEYVSAEEESHLSVSQQFADIFNHKTTHLELTDVSFVGVSAAIAPFFRHNQGPRLAYWIAMSKQIVTSTSIQDHGAVSMNNLWYGQKPVVKTITSELLGFDQEATCINCNVIFFPLNYNQEDAIIMNRASVERGMFVSDKLKTYESSRSLSENRKYDERFEKPNPKETNGLKMGQYDHLNANGVPTVGSKLKPTDVVIGKTIPMKIFSPLAVLNGPKNFRYQQKQRKDMSVQMSGGENGVVHQVTSCKSENTEIVKVVMRSTKIPEVGDKFSSRHAQKGTIGRLEDPENLPFSMQTGMVPDIVMSPLGFPSRMTMGKLLEILVGKGVCISGRPEEGLDNQNFQGTGDEIIAKIGQLLSIYGFHCSGKEMFCDGLTGEMIEATVMSGIVSYAKLNHMVSGKMHARSTGPRHILTHQPNEGRSSNGGLRFGPMEVFLKKKFPIEIMVYSQYNIMNFIYYT